MPKPTTVEWAKSHNISILTMPSAVENYNEPCHFTARQIGVRVLIIQGVVAVASGVDPEPVIEWFRSQHCDSHP